MPETLEELNLLLLTVATPRKVHRDGIHCHGLRYLALTLTAYVGEEVTVRYDPRDLAEIRVFHRNESLCVAVSPELGRGQHQPQRPADRPEPASPRTAPRTHQPAAASSMPSPTPSGK